MVTPLLIVHGGAGLDPAHDYLKERHHLAAVAARGKVMLAAGASAVGVATALVRDLEESGLYIAGRGASPNLAGGYELDAAVMDGRDGSCGAVAALEGYRSAIEVADKVRRGSPHILLAGPGAAHFALAAGAEPVPPGKWFTHAGNGEILAGRFENHGTVGCVARDTDGRLAAAVSTAGVLGKQRGRVGDTPLIGIGCWADANVAVVCTGLGEYFIRAAAASRIAHLVEFGGLDLHRATANTLAKVQRLGGAGGVIAIDGTGAMSIGHVAAGMKSAVLHADGSIEVHIAPMTADDDGAPAELLQVQRPS